jgi:hypothetical protein
MLGIANTPAPWGADPFALRPIQSTDSSSLHRGDRTLFPPNRRSSPDGPAAELHYLHSQLHQLNR